jgi:ABC-type phosphate transport system permease subunit
MISPIQIQKIAFFLIRLMAATVVLILLTLLIFLIYKGIGVISWEFLTGLKTKGREIAENWLNTDYNEVGLKSTFDVEEHFFDKF